MCQENNQQAMDTVQEDIAYQADFVMVEGSQEMSHPRGTCPFPNHVLGAEVPSGRGRGRRGGRRGGIGSESLGVSSRGRSSGRSRGRGRGRGRPRGGSGLASQLGTWFQPPFAQGSSQGRHNFFFVPTAIQCARRQQADKLWRPKLSAMCIVLL